VRERRQDTRSRAKPCYRYTLNLSWSSWSSYESFHEFTWNAPGAIASGCCCLVYRSTKDFASCYRLTGMRIRSGGVQSRPPRLSEGQRAQALQMRLGEVPSLGMQRPDPRPRPPAADGMVCSRA